MQSRQLLLRAILVCLAVGGVVHALPGEVTGQRFDSKQTMAWNALSGAVAYNVYRGDEAGLPDNSACLIGSTPSTSVTVSQNPPAGVTWYYLAAGIDASGAEGSLGSASGGSPRTAAVACIPVRRSLGLLPNGPAPDGVIDGAEPRRNANAQLWSSTREATGLYLHSGEFWLAATDLAIRGRGMDFGFARKYRSQIDYDGPLGHGWDFAANARLVPLGSDVVYHDGTGRRDHFPREDSTHFTSPTGLYAVLREEGDGSFVLRWPDGRLDRFHALDGANVEGTLQSIEDRDGNVMRFLYDHQGLLTTAVDTLGRNIGLAYNAQGRLTSVTDFAGRSWIYSYDGNGDLISVRSPVVTGTPNGNDFPSGKTTAYTYSTGQPDPRLDHNLLTVTAPNEAGTGPARIVNTYGASAIPFDRVVTQAIGGTNASGIAAGGTLGYAYEQLNSGLPPNLGTPRRRTTVTDRNANIGVHTHNFDGNLLTRVEQTNRNVRPPEGDYVTSHSYNADGEIVATVAPEGNQVLYTYDAPGLDRYREGNLREVRQIAGPRGDGHGLTPADVVLLLSYEPLYNHASSVVEPRGNDPAYVPRNGGAQSASRYTTRHTYDYQEGNPATNGVNTYAAQFEIDLTGAALNLGDQNQDGVTNRIAGDRVRTEEPAVLLAPEFPNQLAIEQALDGDNQQQSTTLRQWNAFGQLVLIVDAEHNRHSFVYHPEADPDGDGTSSDPPADGRTLDGSTGGYLATRTIDGAVGASRNNGTDPAPAAIQEDFRYDELGNRTHHVDGRGVLTRRIFNALDQVVELRRAAATADDAGPLGDAATGRGETALAPLALRTRFAYDANDNLVTRSPEDVGQSRGVGSFVDTTYAYDILDRRIETSREATSTHDLVTQYGYDPNENLDEIVHPEGNRDTRVYDERDLLFQATRGAAGPNGGTPSTVIRDYDGNRNLTRFVDGRSHATLLSYDGFDRLVRVVDPLGDTMEQCWDPASNLVRRVRRGPGAGPSPWNCVAPSSLDLSQTDFLHDERNRPFGQDRRLFVASTPANPAVVVEGTLRPVDGFVNRRFEHDRLDRRTFVVEDTEATTRTDYDGVSRPIVATLADGQSTLESFWDDGSNLVERVETDAPSAAGPPAEVFLTTWFHDALGRRQTAVDNVGQSRRWVYDSLDDVVAETDPRGPAGGTINRRSPGREGISVPVNGHGNVTRYAYDGADRRLTVEKVLTASKEGDGTLTPTPDTSNAFNPDGLVTLTTTWDDNSLVVKNVDDRGNETSYDHDNLNRTKLLTSDDGTTTQYQYDANDNLTLKTDANGSVLAFIYDDANRRTQTSITRGTGVVGTTLQTFQYDGLHRLVEAFDNNRPTGTGNTDDDVTLRFFHDSLSRLVEERQQLGPSAATALNTDHQWLAADLETKLVYPDGREIDYAYDAADRLVSTSDPDRAESASFAYFGLGRVHTVTRNNDVTTTTLNDAGTLDVGYDGVRRLVQLRHLDAADAILAEFRYSYDRAGNLRSERRSHHTIGPNLKGELYGHDSLGRLDSFVEGPIDSNLALAGTADDDHSWTLDGASNWPEMARNGTTFTATPNNLNEYDEAQPDDPDSTLDDFLDVASTPQADGRNHAHDENGNQTTSADAVTVDVLRYDALNRLAEVDRDSLPIGRYTYDALGRRVRRAVTNRGALNETLRYVYASASPGEGPWWDSFTGTTAGDLGTPGFGGTTAGDLGTPGFGGTTVDDLPSFGGTTTGDLPNFGGTTVGDLPNFGGTTIGDLGGFTGTTIGDMPLIAGFTAGDRSSWTTDDAYFDWFSRGSRWTIDDIYFDLASTGAPVSALGSRNSHIIEERNAANALVRQVVVADPPGFSTIEDTYDRLWQVRNAGVSAEHMLLDRRGSTIALTPGNDDIVLERVTYDAYGKPTFENAANQKLCEGPPAQVCGMASGPFLGKSTVGNPDLFRGLRYDPELGKRTMAANTDWGGLYVSARRCMNPNEGRFLTRVGNGGWGGTESLGSSQAVSPDDADEGGGGNWGATRRVSPGSRPISCPCLCQCVWVDFEVLEIDLPDDFSSTDADGETSAPAQDEGGHWECPAECEPAGASAGTTYEPSSGSGSGTTSSGSKSK